MEYEALTAEERAQIVEGRLKQLEAEHYTTVLNRRSMERATDMDAEEQARMLADADAKVETLARAISLHREERASLNGGGS